MKKLSVTKFQASEIRHRCEVRSDTVEMDPESGDAFELTAGALDTLKEKFRSLTVELTEAETEWTRGEVENMLDIARYNVELFPEYRGWERSFSNLLTKLS